MEESYFITCLNPDCGEDDSVDGVYPTECQYCGSTDIDVSEDDGAEDGDEDDV